MDTPPLTRVPEYMCWYLVGHWVTLFFHCLPQSPRQGLWLSLELGRQPQVPPPSLPPQVSGCAAALYFLHGSEALDSGPQAWAALHVYCPHRAAVLGGSRGPACVTA